jgi:cytochrome c biogenesis protein CcmG, thiol:disulfide interchange protein DsbE
MKKITTLVAAIIICFSAFAQKKLPNTDVRDLNGKKIAFNKAFTPGKVTIVSFWATWCIPCKQEIANIKEKLEEKQKLGDFEYATVSIDESRDAAKMKAYATSQGWKWPVYQDPNSDLKRSIGFSNVPFTIIIDKEGKIAHMHTGYTKGSEEEIFEKAIELSKAEAKK